MSDKKITLSEQQLLDLLGQLILRVTVLEDVIIKHKLSTLPELNKEAAILAKEMINKLPQETRETLYDLAGIKPPPKVSN